MKNRPAIGMCLASFAQLACFMTIMTMFQYVFQVYFKNTDMIILGSVITSLPMVLLIPFVSKLTKRFGKKGDVRLADDRCNRHFAGDAVR